MRGLSVVFNWLWVGIAVLLLVSVYLPGLTRADATPTDAPTPTPEPTATDTPIPTATPTEIPSLTATPTESPTPTPTVEPTPTPELSPTPTVTEIPSVTPTETPSPTPSEEATPTPTDVPTVAPSPDLTPTPTLNVTPSETPSPSVTPSPTVRPGRRGKTAVERIEEKRARFNQPVAPMGRAVSDDMDEQKNPDGTTTAILYARPVNVPFFGGYKAFSDVYDFQFDAPSKTFRFTSPTLSFSLLPVVSINGQERPVGQFLQDNRGADFQGRVRKEKGYEFALDFTNLPPGIQKKVDYVGLYLVDPVNFSEGQISADPDSLSWNLPESIRISFSDLPDSTFSVDAFNSTFLQIGNLTDKPLFLDPFITLSSNSDINNDTTIIQTQNYTYSSPSCNFNTVYSCEANTLLKLNTGGLLGNLCTDDGNVDYYDYQNYVTLFNFTTNKIPIYASVLAINFSPSVSTAFGGENITVVQFTSDSIGTCSSTVWNQIRTKVHYNGTTSLYGSTGYVNISLKAPAMADLQSNVSKRRFRFAVFDQSFDPLVTNSILQLDSRESLNVPKLYISYNTAPNLTLDDPGEGNWTNSSSAKAIARFNCTAQDDSGLTNVSLWSNFSGIWQVNQTNSTPPGNNTQVTFVVGGLQPNYYVWGCTAYDNAAAPLGNVSANRSIVINASCGTLNFNTTMFNNVSTSGTCFTFNQHNLTLNGGGNAIVGIGGSAAGITISSFHNSTIQNVSFYSMTNGITLTSANASTINFSTFVGLTGSAVRNSGGGSWNSNVTNNYVWNSSQLYMTTGPASSNTNYLRIVNNTVFNQSSSVLYIISVAGGSTHYVFNVSILNNTFANLKFGISLSANNSLVSGNNFTNFSGRGSSGLIESYSSNTTIQNNSMINISRGDATSPCAIYIDGSYSSSLPGGWIDNNNISSDGLSKVDGIVLSGALLASLIAFNVTNNTINVTGNGTVFLDAYADNTTLSDNTFVNQSATVAWVGASADGTFINNTMNRSAFVFSGIEGAGVRVYWYVRVNVTNTTWGPLQNAIVNISNNSDGTGFYTSKMYSDLSTDSSGLTAWKLVEDFEGNNTQNLSFSPHQIMAGKAAYVNNGTNDSIFSTKTVLVVLPAVVPASASFTLTVPGQSMVNSTNASSRLKVVTPSWDIDALWLSPSTATCNTESATALEVNTTTSQTRHSDAFIDFDTRLSNQTGAIINSITLSLYQIYATSDANYSILGMSKRGLGAACKNLFSQQTTSYNQSSPNFMLTGYQNYTLGGTAPLDLQRNISIFSVSVTRTNSTTAATEYWFDSVNDTLDLNSPEILYINYTPAFTPIMNFTGTSSASQVQPCVTETAWCQNSTTPFYIFNNTGSSAINWTIYLNASLTGTGISMRCGNSNVYASATDISSTTNSALPAIVNSSVPSGAGDFLWCWADYSNVAGGVNVRGLIHNASISN